MTDMSKTYKRVCNSLSVLQDEIEARWPGREQNKGFITGYMDPARRGEYSGHYVDNNGICFAYDIGVDIEGDGTGLRIADARWLANYLCEQEREKFQYLIYDGRIRGNHTGWVWAPYTGSSPHRDHIHISVQDVQWGEPSGISWKLFDSRATWGLAAARPPAKPAPTKATTSYSKPTSGLYWTVTRGDTLAKIAAYYAGPTVAEIAHYNRLADADSIEVGQYIRIPTPVYWTVERGDTLQKIASYYGLDWQTVAKSNGITDAYALRVGAVIRIG